MNYKEEFPADINILIQKCESTILEIEKRFLNSNCLIVKELYHSEKNKRQIDFLKKLQITCNNKLNSENKNELKGFNEFLYKKWR
ncbi:hypothetical protein [Frigoriflavimonas asaccharolytica]|uniref:Uncharacterized protein n=1 Tax=Frigoriflavimonas asaccharolytica TaxID=2735899 RepID=A0A8J8KCL3_9FLAO|nr:hypothetical protein [Frigoriflavimonas asaccharolytica]NRS93769.1 hypothetical protein [Frigoriflavimonas asaccharolytica]